jgi:hypothetical protein
MYRSPDDASALKALTADPDGENEFRALKRLQEQNEAQAAFEDPAWHDLAPVGMAEERWELEREREYDDGDSNEQIFDRYE